MGRQLAGAGGGKHASSRNNVDEYRRQIGRYQSHHSRAKFRGRHSVKTNTSSHSQKKNWTLIILSLVVLLILLSGFYAVFAVEMVEAVTWVMTKIRG